MKIEELKKSIIAELEPLSVDFARDYSISQNEYICDCITEFADNNTSIYYSDQKKYYEEHESECEKALSNFGYDLKDLLKECGSLSGLICKAGAIGEYAANEQILYNDLENILKLMLIYYITEENQIKIEEKKLEEVFEDISIIDKDNRFSDVLDLLNDKLEA